LVGKIVWESSTGNSNEMVIPIADLSKGIYNLRIGNETVKVMKE